MSEEKQKPITEMTLDELKITMYDQMVIFETVKNNIELIKQEIAKKVQK